MQRHRQWLLVHLVAVSKDLYRDRKVETLAGKNPFQLCGESGRSLLVALVLQFFMKYTMLMWKTRSHNYVSKSRFLNLLQSIKPA